MIEDTLELLETKERVADVCLGPGGVMAHLIQAAPEGVVEIRVSVTYVRPERNPLTITVGAAREGRLPLDPTIPFARHDVTEDEEDQG